MRYVKHVEVIPGPKWQALPLFSLKCLFLCLKLSSAKPAFLSLWLSLEWLSLKLKSCPRNKPAPPSNHLTLSVSPNTQLISLKQTYSPRNLTTSAPLPKHAKKKKNLLTAYAPLLSIFRPAHSLTVLSFLPLSSNSLCSPGYPLSQATQKKTL